MATQLVVIGCDGILLDTDGTPRQAGLEALARLTHAGYHVVVIAWLTGRSAGNGGVPLDTLGRTQAELQRYATEVGGVIDGFFVCPHGPDKTCGCRPPQPGLFHEIATRWHIDLAQLPCALADPDELAAATAVGANPAAIGSNGDFSDLAAYAESLLNANAAR